MSNTAGQDTSRNTKKSRQTTQTNHQIHQSHQYFQHNLASEERFIQLDPYINKQRRQSQRSNSNQSNKTAQEKNNSKNTGKIVSWQQKYLNLKGKKYQKQVKIEMPKKQQQLQVKKQNAFDSKSVSNQLINQNTQNKKQDTFKAIEVVQNNFFDFNNNNNNNLVSSAVNINISYANVDIGKSKNKFQKLYQQAIKHSNIEQLSQHSSSQNVFQKMNKKKQKREESDDDQNIFDAYKRKANYKDSSSESDDDNIFENKRSKQQQRNIKQSGTQNYSLQKILQSSNLYNNYLVNPATQKKLLKKISLDIPQLQSVSRQNTIPKGCFFKPTRVEFKKIANEQIRQGSYNQNQYLCKVNQDRTCFYYQDLRSQQLKNLNGVKCHCIQLQRQQKMSPHAEYDHIYQRFYLFSNKQQKLCVFSQLSMQLLCKISIQKKVYNPNMHFCEINGRHFLILLGGYRSAQRQIAQGNNNIQIFQMNKWYLDMKSRVVKLIIGRINPILISNKQKNNHSFLILGGNTIAKINSKGQFDFSYEKQINQSTNMSGISINAKEIIQLFEDQQHTTISNLSVKIQDPFCLHSGIVIHLNNRQWLLLPGSLTLFQVKIFNKEVNIIDATAQFFPSSAPLYQKRQIILKNDKESPIIYSIDERGIFHISSSKQRKIQKCCSIY